MGERVRVVRHDGRLLAAKEAGVRGPGALQTEARVLSTVQGPGVVELVGVTDSEPPSLLTRWVGARSLADVPVPLTPERAGALCLAVAATVGRLHRSGVAHGAVDPTHVLLDRHGRPVLCGFGSAGPIGAPVRRPATDQARADDLLPAGTTLRPASDVAGLGLLLDHLLGSSSAAIGYAGWSRSGRAEASRRRALLDVARHACATDPADRPSVAAFTHAVRRAVPGASLADDLSSHDERARPDGALLPRPDAAPERRRRGTTPEGPSRSSRHGRLAAVLALVAVASATSFGLSAWWAPSTDRRADASPVAARPATTAPTTTTTAPTTTTTAPTTTTTLPEPSTTSLPPGAAPVIEHDGHRYEVGRAGDVVAVGPWLCDGRDLPVVLHPADGSVHLFDAWASDGGSLTARLVATVPGASGLERADQRPGCAGLMATDAGRTISTLTTEDLR